MLFLKHFHTVNHPRVHGNGFIQLDLDETKRLHIWGDPRIPRQKVATPIHNHVFSFDSEIIKGRMLNINYIVAEHPQLLSSHKVYTAVCRKDADTILEDMRQRVNAIIFSLDLVTASPVNCYRNTYHVDAYNYHESVPLEPSATIITKVGRTLAQNPTGPQPRVLVPLGVEPDNSFNRYGYDPDLLWTIIKDVLGDLCDL